jgi:hypothetical protein
MEAEQRLHEKAQQWGAVDQPAGEPDIAKELRGFARIEREDVKRPEIAEQYERAATEIERLRAAPAAPDLAALDWERLLSGEHRALDPAHQPIFDQLAAPAAQVPKWIPITERLPDDHAHILVYWGPDEFEKMSIAWNIDRKEWEKAQESRWLHWMPLPAGPYAAIGKGG